MLAQLRMTTLLCALTLLSAVPMPDDQPPPPLSAEEDHLRGPLPSSQLSAPPLPAAENTDRGISLADRDVSPFRVVAESFTALGCGALGGLGGALVGFGVGLGAAAAIHPVGLDVLAVVFLPTIVVGVAGVAVGMPLGVFLAGNALDGHGNGWLTALFGMTGMAAGALVGGLLYSPGGGFAPMIALSLTGGLLGSVLAYEISSVAISPAVGPGSAGLNVKGTF